MLYLGLNRSRSWQGRLHFTRRFIPPITDAFGDAAEARKPIAEQGHFAREMLEE